MDRKEKLLHFQERYDKSRSAYTELTRFPQRKAQFEGSKTIPGGKSATIIWNFTGELIESQIDSSIPLPRVRPQRPTRENIRLAKVIEDMIKGQLDRLPFEALNDMDERMCKVMGGSAYLVEWDNSVKTHDTVGDLSVRLLSASQFVPQQAVDDLQYMDYLFLTFEDTKERIRARYGVSVEDESVDPESGNAARHGDETVTQVMCFYKNAKSGLGCFSWAGETVLVDDNSYEARKSTVCARCGLTRARGENVCVCGGGQWTARPKEFEALERDIKDADGNVKVPAMSPATDENGQYQMENYEIPQLDEQGNPITDLFGGMAMQPSQRAVMEQTRIPYYYPRRFPVVIRKNTSADGQLLGASDCDAIRDFQLGANKLLTKVNERLLKSGSYLAKPATMDFQFSDSEMQPINLDTPDQAAMLRTIELRADISQDLSMVDKYYYMAKSMLGVTDSYQGKPDTTATSGRAKEALIAQAAGRQRSKRVMKHAAYAELFEVMFKFMLAYADEPRVYTSTDENGEQVERVFSRYDFLEQDEYGNWYYNDQFMFSVDESGIDAGDKQFMLEDLRTDLSIGAYGDPSDPETMLSYWKEKEIFGYPNAARNVARWEKRVQAQQQASQQPLMQEEAGNAMPEQAQPPDMSAFMQENSAGRV